MFAIVINKEGYKTGFIVLNEDKTPQDYTLKDGESIITKDWNIANAMGKPRWIGTEWIDEEPLKQIDNCSEPSPKTNEQLTEENSQLWETIEFLLKNIEIIPKETL